MADQPAEKSTPWIVQLAFAAAAGLLVFLFVDMAKNAEARHACDPLVQLRPRYLGFDRSAPDFELSDGAGGKVKLSSLRGKVVILHFWASNCDFCVKELPLVAEFAEKIKDRSDVALVTVTIDENPESIKDLLAALFQGKAPPFPILYDPDDTVIRGKFGTTLFPETWLIDPSGVVRARFDGIPFAGDRCEPIWKSGLLLSAIESLRGPAVCDLTFDPKESTLPDHLIAQCGH